MTSRSDSETGAREPTGSSERAEGGGSTLRLGSADEADDAALVARLNAGETAAFEAIFERYCDWAYAVARRFAHDEGLAADAVQDSFLYLLRKFPGFELRAKLTTFLYPVLKHNAQAAARQRRRRTPALAQREPDGADLLGSSSPQRAGGDGDGNDGASGTGETHGALLAALDSLPDHHREVLLMRVVHGMSVNEVSLAIGVPPGTVKSRLFHASKALRGHPALRDVAGADR